MLDYPNLPRHRGSIIQYRHVAATFPWCFPKAFIPDERTAGVAPIVGVYNESTGSFISAVVVGNHTPPPSRTAPLHEQKQHLRNAINTSNEWLLDHLPIWLANTSPFKHTLYQLTGASISSVDGASAGLSCLLASIGKLLNLPLASDWIYSATISDAGELGRVNSIVEKAKGIKSFCPSVNHFVIGNYDIDTEATIQHIQSLGIQVYSFKTVQEALNTIPIGPFKSIHEAIEHSMEQWVSEENNSLHQLIENTFLSVLQGFRQIHGWGSLRNMMMRIRNHPTLWIRLSKDAQYKLEITALIASRYLYGKRSEYNTSTCPIVFTNAHLDWLSTCRDTERLQLLPHMMQQLNELPESILCADEILTLVQSELPNPKQDWILPLQLKLAGSWGRYLATRTHRYQEAYEWQLLCFYQWCDHGFYEQASYPICALLDLSESLPEHTDHIEQLWRDFTQKPNAKVSQIRRFIPKHWQNKLFGAL